MIELLYCCFTLQYTAHILTGLTGSHGSMYNYMTMDIVNLLELKVKSGSWCNG